MSDIIAAIGLAQLRKVDAMLTGGKRSRGSTTTRSGGYAEIEVPTVRHPHPARVASVPASSQRGVGSRRDDFIDELKKAQIGTSVHFIPLHVHPTTRLSMDIATADLPVALAQYRREISLPIYSRMSDSDVRSVIDAVFTSWNSWRRPIAMRLRGH
jgi:perosamine synthetase